jgi:hypothetical protein
MPLSEQQLQLGKNILLKKVDEIYLLGGQENYTAKYMTQEEFTSFSLPDTESLKKSMVNNREFLRLRLNQPALSNVLTTEEYTDVQNAYEYSRIKVKILYNLPLD